MVGIAGGDSISVDGGGNIMIYTGETAQVMTDSKDNAIHLEIQGSKKNVTVTDAKRIYKLSGNGQAPASITTPDMLQSYGNHIDEKEFRGQISPVTQITMKMASGESDKSDGKEEVFADESNTYVVNFQEGSEVVAIQTLRKSLEVARKNLIDKENDDKSPALEIFKLLSSILENPEFNASEGYDDFKASVYKFSYKIPDMENRYGFTQMKTFFENNKDELSSDLIKEFWKVMTLLDHGPGGEDGACMAFNGNGHSVQVVTTLTPLLDGTTKQTSEIFDKGTIPTIAKLLESGLNGPKDGAKEEGDEDGKKGKEDEKKTGTGAEGAKGGEGGEGAEGAKGGTDSTATDVTPPATMTSVAAAAAAAAAAEVVLASKMFEEVDVKRVWGDWEKGYIIKRYKFNNLPTMLLVHYVGYLLSNDEFIPESKESELIRPRTEKSGYGREGIHDGTLELLKGFYTEEMMRNYDIEAREAAKKEKSEQDARNKNTTQKAGRGNKQNKIQTQRRRPRHSRNDKK